MYNKKNWYMHYSITVWNGTAEHNFTCMSISDLMAFPSAHFNFSLALPKIKEEDRDLICDFGSARWGPSTRIVGAVSQKD